MKVALPQTIVVVLGPPSPFNRLFIMTGTAVEDFPPLGARNDDNFTRTPQGVVDLSLFHGHIFNPGISQVAVSAAPASFTGSDNADDFAWAVDQAFPVIKPDGTLELHYDRCCRRRRPPAQGRLSSIRSNEWSGIDPVCDLSVSYHNSGECGGHFCTERCSLSRASGSTRAYSNSAGRRPSRDTARNFSSAGSHGVFGWVLNSQGYFHGRNHNPI
jgi:hypothetical protein